MSKYWFEIFRIARSDIDHNEKITKIIKISNQYPCKKCSTHFNKKIKNIKEKELLKFLTKYYKNTKKSYTKIRNLQN